MRNQTDVFPRIRQNITAAHGTLIRPPMHMPRSVCLQPISPVIIYRRKRTKIVRAQSIQPPHVCVAGAVDHAIRLSFVQMHRNDPFAQSIPVTAFPRCAAVRIQPVKEKHEYVAAPDRGGIPCRAQSRGILCGRPHPRRRAAPYASAPMNPRRGSANTARLQRKNGTYRPVF